MKLSNGFPAGWEQEVLVQSAPVNTYVVVGAIMAAVCAVFVYLVIRYGLMR